MVLTLHPKVAIEIYQMQNLQGPEANLTGKAGKLEAVKDIDLLNILSLHMCVYVCFLTLLGKFIPIHTDVLFSVYYSQLCHGG